MLNEIKNIRKRIKELEMMRALNHISPGTFLEIMKEIREQDRQLHVLERRIESITYRYIQGYKAC